MPVGLYTSGLFSHSSSACSCASFFLFPFGFLSWILVPFLVYSSSFSSPCRPFAENPSRLSLSLCDNISVFSLALTPVWPSNSRTTPSRQYCCFLLGPCLIFFWLCHPVLLLCWVFFTFRDIILLLLPPPNVAETAPHLPSTNGASNAECAPTKAMHAPTRTKHHHEKDSPAKCTPVYGVTDSWFSFTGQVHAGLGHKSPDEKA
ncbi:hypothetical protein FN846DRAFT_931813 [Sphaerosporella brunnea]|uniref:Transmembrane protein n=1 Tax=Sphaerosporella brunnea TaxID=1250544 RepID=A0A5J5F7C1_9PEZI|nr:hypothetical protein FN846DRAFT_931813 [Sphaerosporella brunnea]